jgi:hypothetical protein
MDRLFLFPNLKFGYAYHTLGSRSKKRWISVSGQRKSFIAYIFDEIVVTRRICRQKKMGAGGKSAPLLMENLQGESMSVFDQQFGDRKLLRALFAVCGF